MEEFINYFVSKLHFIVVALIPVLTFRLLYFVTFKFQKRKSLQDFTNKRRVELRRKNEELLDICPELKRGSSGYNNNMDPVECGRFLRKMNQAEFLDASSNDLCEFYFAHHAFIPNNLTALSIRFTAHYNLFLGSVKNLGTLDQLDKVISRHNKGELGCFCLTEKGAGVMSGLVVETTCHYSSQLNAFILNTPTEEAAKTWISQGLIAEMGVVIAKLFVDEKDLGLHAFLIDMNLPGVERSDMGPKTDCNALDNAKISFQNVKLSLDSLLGKYCEMKNGVYVEKMPFKFLDVAARLMAGRVAIPSSMIAKISSMLQDCITYCKKREVYVSRRKKRALWNLPYMRDALRNMEDIGMVLESYMSIVEKIDITKPTDFEVDMISVGKVAAVGFSIRCHDELRTMVGSYSLMDGTFGSGDIFLCAKFAEGDSRILQQKMIRGLLSSRNPFSFLLELCFALPMSLLGSTYYSMICSRNWRLLKLTCNMAFKSKSKAFDCWYDMLDVVFETARIHELLTISSIVHQEFGYVKEIDAFHKAYKENSFLLSD